MFSRILTKKYTRDSLVKAGTNNATDKMRLLINKLEEADCIIIGAGAGLSSAAGFIYDGERFHMNFSDFEEKYDFHDMYTGGFYPFNSLEEHWAYWSRMIYVNRYLDAPKPLYDKIYKLVSDKDYFVLTTNVDHCFQKAGFDKSRLFYTQGDYGLFQCSKPCSQETYDNEDTVMAMIEEQKNMCIPSNLLPVCPHCGRPMTMNLRSDETFVQDEGWYRAANRYDDYIKKHSDSTTLFLELGVGYNTPGIIKYPFWQMTSHNPKATYACINKGQAYAPDEIQEQSICIDADIDEVIDTILDCVTK